jgi:hypothetical protein
MKGPVGWWRQWRINRALKEHGVVWTDHKDRIIGTGRTYQIPNSMIGEPVYLRVTPL